MAYLKNWTDNLFQMFFMGTSWVAVSINNIKTRTSREMTSRKNIFFFFDFNSMNVAKHWYGAGEVFAISDCLVSFVFNILVDPSIYVIQYFLSGIDRYTRISLSHHHNVLLGACMFTIISS